ncbi:hypothetical protein LSCM1_03097 [Leishmania martiniquensis]|uniref:Uncharacterized protein n=1 Tax=Leishmania martiniquensis TaxID=1580590 RepID=A0A836GUS7_9TRYP|nr:hypothetical protein LSCM1_03097 [Leishmania martiniquensis]
MRSSCVAGALRGAVVAHHSSSPTCAAARLYTSNFGKANADAEPTDAEQTSDNSDEQSRWPSSYALSQPPQRYRRRSSDPQTLRERADFRRDHKYAKHRPLPDVPWRELKTKTYLDDAERLYGRKETWHTVKDAALREKLVAILQDYLRDTLAAARLEARDARKYAFLCSTAAKHYRAHVSSGAFGLREGLQEWARGVVAGRAPFSSAAKLSTSSSTSSDAGDDDAGAEGTTQGTGDSLAPSHAASVDKHNGNSAALSPSQEDLKAAQFREERRLRGAEASLIHTVAMENLPDADLRHSPHSAFPFLRQRAVENKATLDPSLVDWTAKYFSEDDASTFAEPPRLRAGMVEDEEESAPDLEAARDSHQGGGASSSGACNAAKGRQSTGFAPLSPSTHRPVSIHARHRLQRPLRDHENRHRATFDAEGIYYKVRRQSEVEERAPKPQEVKASDLEAPGRRPDVVKVPWSVAAKAKAQSYSSDTLRAKERLIRLTRGEDPDTIP